MTQSLIDYFRARFHSLVRPSPSPVPSPALDPTAIPGTGLEVILTHEHTDFDALASLLGAALLFPHAVPVLPRRLNRNVHGFLALYKNHFPFITYEDLPAGKVVRAILVDARAVNWVRGMDKQTKLYIIDHHVESKDSLPAGATLIHEPVGANTTLLVELLLQQAGSTAADLRLSPVHATLLALGIHEDTGSLTYSSTTHRDAHCLAWLLEPKHGVNLEVVGRFLNHPLNEAQRNLLDLLIEQSEFHTIAGHTVVIAQAQAPGFKDELSALVGRLRNYHECDAIFMVVGLDDIVQVVARSMTDDIDVGNVATVLGGGGHTRAAAAPVQNTDDARAVAERVLAEIRRNTRPAVTVAQIMSAGRPQSLAPNISINDAAILMSRYGHEGFPVLETDAAGNERVLGVLTRREADRAINHKMGDQPVSRFMRAGTIAISARAGIGDLRRLMTESNWGQIPVLDDSNKIVGIVTRTDLIKLWDATSLPTSHAPAVTRKLQRALMAQDLALLRLVGREVEKLGFAVYIVGGFVRDMLLNHAGASMTAIDMDIVIEGDAIAFARHWMSMYGGRIVPHRRFNTAKWIVDDPNTPIDTISLARDLGVSQDSLAPFSHLDFVSARTEFYTAPTALPTVEDSSIKLDLHRRDFSINTLAICLNPPRWGELLDFYGGLKDLEGGIIRVLHSLSFVDDPTRILRAVRYEQRFNFTVERRTLELLCNAIELLDRVTAARVRHEMERIFQEKFPEQTLWRLHELSVLSAIHPGWHMVESDKILIHRVRTAHESAASRPELRATPLADLYWGAISTMIGQNRPAPADSALWPSYSLSERLGLPSSTQQLLIGLDTLRHHESALQEPDLLPSQVASFLDQIPLPALALAEILAHDKPAIRHLLAAYLEHWQHIHAHLDGNDLMALGIPRGPIYREILTALRNSRMDGHLHTHEEATQLALQMAESSSPQGSPPQQPS